MPSDAFTILRANYSLVAVSYLTQISIVSSVVITQMQSKVLYQLRKNGTSYIYLCTVSFFKNSISSHLSMPASKCYMQALMLIADSMHDRINSLDHVDNPFKRIAVHGDLAHYNLVASVNIDGRPIVVRINLDVYTLAFYILSSLS